MINRVTLVGKLVRDAELKHGRNGPRADMGLATNTIWRDPNGERRESAEYHRLVAYRHLAEICGQMCLRDRRIYAEGRLRTREYEDECGVKKMVTEIVLDTMRVLDRRPDPATSGEELGQEQAQPNAVGASFNVG
jgi:single-strand DNA-binding protein